MNILILREADIRRACTMPENTRTTGSSWRSRER